MSITYRQENNGHNHVIHIQKEKWSFLTEEEFLNCVKFLTTNEIPFKVDYSFEVYHIEIQNEIWRGNPESMAEEEIKKNDKKFQSVLLDILNWKTHGTRPQKINFDEAIKMTTQTYDLPSLPKSTATISYYGV